MNPGGSLVGILPLVAGSASAGVARDGYTPWGVLWDGRLMADPTNASRAGEG
jgi:hypothetical protein